MKIAIIGHVKYPIARPFAGGLEAFTHSYVSCLQKRGHDVTLFASGDSDLSLPLQAIVDRGTVGDSITRLGCQDNNWIEAVEDEAYEGLVYRLGNSNFDVVHNHSLSPIPLRFASLLPCPMVTTLHTPCLPRMSDEIGNRGIENVGSFVNISDANCHNWSNLIPSQQVIPNGVDTMFWKTCRQPKRNRAIWFGRILPDKGTHYAIDAAHRAGIPIDVVGPISDDDYFREQVHPRLLKTDEYHGHQPHERLCGLISRSAVAIITPCWDEPFGLVIAEALACGTPVAGFARGALPEIVRPSVGRLATCGDVDGLAIAIHECRSLSDEVCRRYAQEHYSDSLMMNRYETLYHQLIGQRVASPTSIQTRVDKGGSVVSKRQPVQNWQTTSSTVSAV